MSWKFILDFSDTNVAHKLEQAGRAGTETMHAMADIAANMMEAEDQLFLSQGRRGGGSWKPLKPDTIWRKDSSVILVDTTELYESLTKVGSEFQVLNIGNTEIEYGTDVPYANIHMTGAPRRNIPARPFIRFTATDRQHWIDILSNHLMRAFRATS